ncbi:hypothetical protein F2Q68_00016995 [Brassica cretica]|uniref:Uncharacterized protein n=1 Tax=Brassica cretica TaxID=69181 RepID=A0A8S9HRM6_BRACR|nr:hypothetical protein F2Q68_00016995 [Brassica cretica]
MAFFTFCFQTRPWSFWKVMGDDYLWRISGAIRSCRLVWIFYASTIPNSVLRSRMANSSFLLADFEATFQICLLRFWKAMNEKRDGERMGVDMLLLDSKVSPA